MFYLFNCFRLVMLSFLLRPFNSCIERYTIYPCNNGRLFSKRRDGMPYLYYDLLEKIVPIGNSKCISTNYFKDESLMATEPIIENVFLFFIVHVIVPFPIST